MNQRSLILGIVFSLIATPAFCCAVCFGDPASPLTKALNLGIFTLLGVIFTVLISFVSLFWNIRNRSRMIQTHQ